MSVLMHMHMHMHMHTQTHMRREPWPPLGIH
jgi:hypothetical protein